MDPDTGLPAFSNRLSQYLKTLNDQGKAKELQAAGQNPFHDMKTSHRSSSFTFQPKGPDYGHREERLTGSPQESLPSGDRSGIQKMAAVQHVFKETPVSQKLSPDKPGSPLTKPNVSLPKEGPSRPDPGSFKKPVHQKAVQVTLNQQELISHQPVDTILHLQSPQADMMNRPALDHQKQKTGRADKGGKVSEADKGKTTSPSNWHFAHQNEGEAKGSLTHPKSQGRQSASPYLTFTTDTGGSTNRIKKVCSPEHFGHIEYTGPFMNKDHSGSPLPALGIPPSAEEVLQPAISHLSAHLKNHGSNLIIDLYPEYLGKLHINLEVKENNLRVHIMADNPLAQKILEENLAILKASLINQGVNVENLSVSIGGHDQNQPGEQTFKRQPQRGGEEIKDVKSSSEGKLAAAQEQTGTYHEYNGTNYLA
ncbi:MAG: flagellar hook-length control protein FliK [bacterium]